MPYRPGQAKEQTATTDVEYEDESISVTYRKKLVQAVCINITEGTEIEQARNLRQALEDLVVSWDVLDADGEPMPATKDVTRLFEFEFLMAVFNGIVTHALPGEGGGATSPTGSSTTATSARARKSTR